MDRARARGSALRAAALHPDRSSKTTSRRSACRARRARSLLKGFVSDRDAFQVKKIKDAGAIVIAKSNMARVRVQPVRDAELAAGTHEESVRARPRAGRLERRHGGGRRRQLRGRRARQRHRQLDPRAVVAHRPRRHSVDDGIDEPGRRDSAELPRGHRRADGAHGGRHGRGLPGDRRRRSRRPDDQRAAGAAPCPRMPSR